MKTNISFLKAMRFMYLCVLAGWNISVVYTVADCPYRNGLFGVISHMQMVLQLLSVSHPSFCFCMYFP